jgi:ABC-type lipoprotein release transport system permease subunit
VLLGLFGTAIGALVGLAGCALLNSAHLAVPQGAQMFVMSDQLHLAIRAPLVIGSALFITLCTGAAALIPSFLAARLKPVTAMHHIG